MEVVEVDEPGSAINVAEQATFRLQVTSRGDLDVLNLSLLVEGRNGTLVKGQGALAQFGDETK